MSVAAPKCNILKFVYEYTIRRSMDIPVTTLSTSYLKNDFLSRNGIDCSIKFLCLSSNDSCNTDVINVVPDTCICPTYVTGYVTQVGVTYFANFSFDMSEGFLCPFVIKAVSPFTSFDKVINNLTDFTSNIGDIYTLTFLIGGYPDLTFSIEKLTGSLCRANEVLPLCDGPIVLDTSLDVNEDDDYVINIEYSICGDNCQTIRWNYVQSLPIGGADSGTFNDTVECDDLPFSTSHIVNPTGVINPGDTVSYLVTRTNCCGNTSSFTINYEVPLPDSLLLYQSPWTEEGSPVFTPYAFILLSITDGIHNFSSLPQIIYTEIQEDAMIVTLNGILSAALFTGSIVKDITNKLYYNPGVGETPAFLAPLILLPRHYSVGIDASLNGNVSMRHQRSGGSGTGQTLVDWGDASLNAYTAAGAGIYAMSHSYTFGGYLVANFFHNDTIKYVLLGDNIPAAPVCPIIVVSGEEPANTQQFAINNSPLFGSITGYVTSLPITRCAANLIATGIVNTNIVGLTAGMFAANFVALNIIAFYGNKLTSSAVDNAFNEFTINTSTPVIGGTFNISIQTPSAPPTGTSLAARTFLTNTPYFWTITTD